MKFLFWVWAIASTIAASFVMGGDGVAGIVPTMLAFWNADPWGEASNQTNMSAETWATARSL